jgi:hypothetical protein
MGSGAVTLTVAVIGVAVDTLLVAGEAFYTLQANASDEESLRQEEALTHEQNQQKLDPEPASGGRGVRRGKKDRSLDGAIDQLHGVEGHQADQTKKGGYRPSVERSKQDIQNIVKKIQNLLDALDK